MQVTRPSGLVLFRMVNLNTTHYEESINENIESMETLCEPDIFMFTVAAPRYDSKVRLSHA